MADPTTVNRGLAVPLRGSDPGTWDTPINANTTIIDTIVGGLSTIATSGGTTILNPAQYACGTIRITGALTSDALITFPAVQGWWTVENRTTGSSAIQVDSIGGTEVIAAPPGELIDIQVTGAVVRYRNFGRIGSIEMWGGITTIPRWVNLCTTPPYVECDGTLYPVAQFPYLGAILGSTFGGDGVTTFRVPDLRGRLPIHYDNTAARITTGGSGLNGQLLGSALDQQVISLNPTQIPQIQSQITSPLSVVSQSNNFVASNSNDGTPINPGGSGGAGGTVSQGGGGFSVGKLVSNGQTSGGGAIVSTNTSGGSPGAQVNNVQPSLMTGINVMRAG
ncbi:tail fiber protein [Bradyrhizobium genosp. L]|uniref:phage tail protein n=1 Tax=Bradyrhizobium genosp. L TaxID=83637 RepID=UPI0018A28008|nr:tail fiber protein [Bradyrhizobium genosp. L]QPF87034.1 tail fiber protein [Bradyrhizobium genosp. L]